MTYDTDIREQGYQYFLREAPELLQAIEQELFSLDEERSLVKVHNLMRITHTLKGSAANVGLETIKTIAHHLEDVFKALYNPDVALDTELKTLLWQGYDCLQLPLMAEITGDGIDDHEVMERAVSLFAKLQEKLGDYLNCEPPIPTSIELGFDITQSIFEVGVKQRLESLAEVLLTNSDASEVADALQEQAEIFVGLAESLNLPGFGAIAQTTIAALAANPQQAHRILEVALEDFDGGWKAVILGDRICGGSPSFALQQLAETAATVEEELVIEQASDELNIEFDISNLEFPDVLDESEVLLEIDDSFNFIDSVLELEDNQISEDNIMTSHVIIEPVNELISLDNIDFDINLPASDVEKNYASDVAIEIENSCEVEPNLEPSIEKDFGSIETQLEPPVAKTEPIELSSQNSEIIEAAWEEAVKQTSTPNAQPTVKLPRPSVRVDLDILKRLSHLAGELLIHQNRQSNINEQLQASIKQIQWWLRRHQKTISYLRDQFDHRLIVQDHQTQKLSSIAGQNNPAKSSKLVEISSGFDALELDNYGEIHELLQSALEEILQLEEATDSTGFLAKQSSQIQEKERRLLSNVQDDMEEAQMLPVGDIFNRFPRLLQQLSTSHKKNVELKLRGTEVLVDRALAEKLYNPLLHLVRNAFDHGIEPPEVRAHRGKSETGQIEIRAYHQGNQTIIQVSDDGEGIDCDRIRERAVELNLISQEKADRLSESAVLDLLFEPGFSTAAKVSDLSGRGIGLDVVRSQIQKLSGSVIIRSQPERGTTFLLQLPMTLTMAKLMICESGGAVYALLSDAIEQILIPKSNQIQQYNNQKILHLKQGISETIVPVYGMANLLAEQSASNLSSENSNSKSTPLLLLRQRSQKQLWGGSPMVGLQVDQILGEQELVIRPLGRAIAPPSYVYGGSTLADGRLTLVIDGAALIHSLQKQANEQLKLSDLRGKTENNYTSLNRQSEMSKFNWRSPQHSKILIVDDSISLRQTLALTLQKAGYQVLQAQNGREALQQLRQNQGVKLVICDVEMPTMNGFEFLTYSRQDPELAKIPVVMLTSRTSEKHRLLARELGAAGYFNKPYQENKILDALADFVVVN